MVAERARLFAAIEVPGEVRDGVEAAVEPLRRTLPEARWVAADAYHLTLAFAGWVDDRDAGLLEDACAEAAAAVSPFTLTLSGRAGAFGSGVLWAGLADCGELDRLAGVLRDAMVARDLTVEQRPFHAHVTLARAGRGARIRRSLVDGYEGPASSWRVQRVVLLRSRLRRSGARYSVAGAWLLDSGPA